MALRAAVVLLGCLAMMARAAEPFGTDLNGHPVERIAPPGAKAVVLFFAASDCPISNRYIPEIERLNGEFARQGVSFWWVYPNPGDTAAVVRQHDVQFNIRADSVLDTEQRLTRMAHATITPEVAVFISSAAGLREVYRGRIDDRYLALGQERPAATKHDLEMAIRAVLDNGPVPKPGGPPVGCSIVPRDAP
ncbi:MAG TPA: redoxin domain-containing protein [Terracidiphilus sp.]|nr:redoxin domain-containing protein [Terracidiphilus sp.]